LQYHRAHDDHKPVDVARVEMLLSERLACKMARNFARADQLRDELKQGYNVEVHDTERVWHVSRAPAGSPARPHPHRSRSDRPGDKPGERPGFESGFDGDFSAMRQRRARSASHSRSRSPERSRSPDRTRPSNFS